MMRFFTDFIYKAKSETAQTITEEALEQGLVDPIFSVEAVAQLYYQNVYHRKALLLKASLLSNLEDGSKLESAITDGMPKQFLKAFILNLEIFGNAFIEMAHKHLYILPSYYARVDINHNIYQWHDNKKTPIEGKQLAYYSPRSTYYGEPDYLASLEAIATNAKIDAFNNAFFSNSARADKAIIFEGAEPSDEQLGAFREFFGSNFRGYNNAHKTLVISAQGENAKVKIEDLSKIDDLSFEKLKSVTRDEIIAAHGVPPRMMGVVTAGNLGGGGELIGQLHSFNELTIIPKQEEIEWFFDSIGYPVKLKPIDVANYKDDAELVGSLISQGIIDTAEARRILRL
jgi:hypothetical protein